MGNSQSNRSGRYSNASGGGRLAASRISGPASLGSSNHSVSPAVRRRASAHPTNTSQGDPDPRDQVQTHRRARSAIAVSSNSIRNRDTAPPPTYSVAIADTSHLAPPPTPLSPTGFSSPPQTPPSAVGRTSSAPGSSHTRVLSMPTASPIPEIGQPGPSSQRRNSQTRNSAVEGDQFSYLRKYNTVFVVDDSASMRGARWKEAANALVELADKATMYDSDGIDVCFFNKGIVAQNVKYSNNILQAFRDVDPKGLSLMGQCLENLLLYYLGILEKAKTAQDNGDEEPMKAIKPVNYIVITDGAPTDAPEDVIVEAARRLDRGNFPLTQVGIQIVQIGDNPEATAFLRKLDDELTPQFNCRDIVDTTPYDGGNLTSEALVKILLGAINRRIDRMDNRVVTQARW